MYFYKTKKTIARAPFCHSRQPASVPIQKMTFLIPQKFIQDSDSGLYTIKYDDPSFSARQADFRWR
jgi:hypothetical protein